LPTKSGAGLFTSTLISGLLVEMVNNKPEANTVRLSLKNSFTLPETQNP
jgi:hypothetical protein